MRIAKYLPMVHDKHISRTQLFKRVVSEFALKNGSFHNLDSLQLFLSSLFQVYPGKRSKQKEGLVLFISQKASLIFRRSSRIAKNFYKEALRINILKKMMSIIWLIFFITLINSLSISMN